MCSDHKKKVDKNFRTTVEKKVDYFFRMIWTVLLTKIEERTILRRYNRTKGLQMTVENDLPPNETQWLNDKTIKKNYEETIECRVERVSGPITCSRRWGRLNDYYKNNNWSWLTSEDNFISSEKTRLKYCNLPSSFHVAGERNKIKHYTFSNQTWYSM